MSPPSPVAALSGWKGRNETMTVVRITAARIVAARRASNAAAKSRRSVLFRLPVLLIRIPEFGGEAAQRDMHRVGGTGSGSRGQKKLQPAQRRGGEQSHAF